MLWGFWAQALILGCQDIRKIKCAPQIDDTLMMMAAAVLTRVAPVSVLPMVLQFLSTFRCSFDYTFLTQVLGYSQQFYMASWGASKAH